MSELIWLPEAWMRRIEPHFSAVARRAGVDDRRIAGGIVFMICNGLR